MSEQFRITDEIITSDTAVKIAQAFALRFRNEVDSNAIMYLFGSTAKNIARPWSDIDVAIVSDKFMGFNNSADTPFYALLTYQICNALEIHTYNCRQWDKNSGMVAEIKQTGVEI